MANWQLTLLILAAVFVGALIPAFIMLAMALHRAGKEVAEMAGQLTRTLTKAEVIADRVEVLSRGFKGGETNIADALASIGHLARGLERNMKLVNMFSTMLAAVGSAVAAFIATRATAGDSGSPPMTDGSTGSSEDGPPASPAGTAPAKSTDSEIRNNVGASVNESAFAERNGS